jgi:hypothetical protein
VKRLQVDWIYRKILDISCLTILYLRYDKSKKQQEYDEKSNGFLEEMVGKL